MTVKGMQLLIMARVKCSGNHVLRNGENCYRKIEFSIHGGEDENLIHEQGLVYSTPESVLA